MQWGWGLGGERASASERERDLLMKKPMSLIIFSLLFSVAQSYGLKGVSEMKSKVKE